MESHINLPSDNSLNQLPKNTTNVSSFSSIFCDTKNFIFRPSCFLIFLIIYSLLFFIIFLQWRGDTIIVSSISAPVDSPRTKSSSHDFTKIWMLYNDSYNVSPKICITSTTSAGLDEILEWIFFHKVVGVSNFFLFLEGKAASPNVSTILKSISGVKVILRTRELEEQQAKSRIWNETWLASSFHMPCNGALFVNQTFNMEMAISMAREAGMEWIIHLDSDELLHPAGSPDYSITQILARVPSDIDTVIFQNYESAVERDDIQKPFTEVSLFKKNFLQLTNNTNYFELYTLGARGNQNYFIAYGNGKSAARIQDHLRPNGAHRWNNYAKEPKEITLDETVVLHYTYARFSDLTSRRDRCKSCQPTKEDVKRCFWLQFDQNAFIIASTETPEEMLEWYRDHVVWTNEKMNLKLLNYGLMTRIYTPMVIIQKLRESGIFASVITSAQPSSPGLKSLSMRKFLFGKKLI